MILEWHLFLRLSLGFVWEILSFVGKHLSFYAKDVCSSSVIFISYLNEKELNQQVCLIKYAENEIPNSTSKKKRERKRSKNIANFKNFNSKTHEKLPLVTVVTNFHKLSLLPLVVRPWQKFEKQKLVLNFESCYCYFKWVIFS